MHSKLAALCLLPAVTTVAALAINACAPRDDSAESDGTWVGTITAEGNVTTVVNESGSVWGGTVRLIEEMSIGMADGPEVELFGRISGVGMTQGRIFVLDHQLRLIRSYDEDGNHLADCGGPGQGPAELDPSTFYTELGTSPAGQIFAHSGNELEIFTADCEHVETRTIDERFTLGSPMVVTDDGAVYLSVPLDRTQPPDDWVYGMQVFGSEGRSGEPIPQPTFTFEPEEIELRRRMNNGAVLTSRARAPYTPAAVWSMSPSGVMVGGVSTSYRFEIIHADGRRTVVLRAVEPIQLAADESDWHARWFRVSLGERSIDPRVGTLLNSPRSSQHSTGF